MTLDQGFRLGPYRIDSPLGAGGMGEVYRAHDTRLNRAVAIKVLPAILAADPDAQARFEQEVHAIAALSRWDSRPRTTVESSTATSSRRTSF